MINPRNALVATALSLGLLAACGGTDASETAVASTDTDTTVVDEATATDTEAATGDTTNDETEAAATEAETTETATSTDSGGPGGRGGGPGGAVDVASVSTEEELIALVQEAYGDGALDLHRGHQPVQDVLNAVLAISHEELHVYMEEQDMNLAAVATAIGVDPQTLIDALVEAWSPAIDNVVASGAITDDEAAQYLDDLEAAFTFRVTWDGVEAEPTYTGIA